MYPSHSCYGSTEGEEEQHRFNFVQTSTVDFLNAEMLAEG
jgi:hypothetical protein